MVMASAIPGLAINADGTTVRRQLILTNTMAMAMASGISVTYVRRRLIPISWIWMVTAAETPAIPVSIPIKTEEERAAAAARETTALTYPTLINLTSTKTVSATFAIPAPTWPRVPDLPTVFAG